jgi:CRISPR-associated endoribonuclease Cas6
MSIDDLILRIILHLKPLNEYIPTFEYHHRVQGFIYSLLTNTSFEGLHDKKGYKFFSFSNIFAKVSTDSSSYNLIIASPSSDFINQISYQLQKVIEYQIPIEIGSLFELQEFIIVKNNNLTFPLEIITGSPILVRIPIEKFKEVSTNSALYKSIYWRSSHPLQLFIDALESNLKKKYTQLISSELKEEKRLFESFKFKKQVSTRLQVGNTKIPLIGSLWEFVFSADMPKDIQLLALDSGLGERNSLGFGFMNPIIRKPH